MHEMMKLFQSQPDLPLRNDQMYQFVRSSSNALDYNIAIPLIDEIRELQCDCKFPCSESLLMSRVSFRLHSSLVVVDRSMYIYIYIYLLGYVE